MAAWVEVVFKGSSIADLGVVGAAEGDLLVAGGTPFTFAALTTGTVGQVLESGGAGAGLSWEDAALVNGNAEGDLLVAGSGAFAFAVLTTGTVGQVLESGGAGAPLSWGDAGTGDFKADGTVPMTGDLDFDNNAAIDMKLHTTVPASPADGHIYFDTSADKVKIYIE